MFIIYLQWGILLKNSLIVAEPMPILCPQTAFHILVYTCNMYVLYRIHSYTLQGVPEKGYFV